ncbi:type II toxin-antitoxin system PemK/MazF family toxin [Enterococcus hirae]|uniref:type II toxin-antitoxin system PemK/MazF family toxin n=1 Tax=Enterococcus hirae TaxID=1354 RepID=UPI002EC5C557|nr:type II toxin-antitoxin system PemK/MazF family toxin [Enterococcus hirae]
MQTDKSYVSNRDYRKGEVFEVYFPDDGSFAKFSIKGNHPAVVIQDSNFPRKTVLVVPITGLLDKFGNEKDLIPTDIRLSQTESFLTKDSVMKCEQISVLSRNDLGKRLGKLSNELIFLLDIQLMSVLELQNTVDQIVESEIIKRYGESDEEQGDIA